MTFGITPTGFNRKTYYDISTSLQTNLEKYTSKNLDFDPRGPIGQLATILTTEFDELWQLAEDVYHSQYPDTASDKSLDHSVALTGITRDPAKQSEVLIYIKSSNEFTAKPNDLIISNKDTSIKYYLDQEIKSLKKEGNDFFEAEATFSSTEVGITQKAIAGTLQMVIENKSNAKIISVNNPKDAIPGKDTETDIELRERRRLSLARGGTGTIPALKARILDQEKGAKGATACYIEKKFINFYDKYSNPPTAIRQSAINIYVLGGEKEEIAKIIFENSPAGSFFDGANIDNQYRIPVNVTDSEGQLQEIIFYRPITLPVYVSVDYYLKMLDKDLPTPDYATILTDIVTSYASKLSLSDPVIWYELFADISNAKEKGSDERLPFIKKLTLKIGKDLENMGQENLEDFASNEIAFFDTKNIVITKHVID